MCSLCDTNNDRVVLPVFDLGVAPYLAVQSLQVTLRRAVAHGLATGALLLLEHTPVATRGAHAPQDEVLDHRRASERGVTIVRSERGGRTTVHAPGQLVSYPVMRIPGRDLRAYVRSLEDVLILLLADLGLRASRVPGSPGVYLSDRKIGSLGLKCEHGVTSHGSSLNVEVDLGLFDLIVSCGDSSLRQTDIKEHLGRSIPMPEVKASYIRCFERVFRIPLSAPVEVSATHLADPLAPGSPLHTLLV